MGSPLGPYFASIFHSFHENTWLENFYDCGYVDDCFLLFCSPEHINLFFNVLNRQYANIKFISEI